MFAVHPCPLDMDDAAMNRCNAQWRAFVQSLDKTANTSQQIQNKFFWKSGKKASVK